MRCEYTSSGCNAPQSECLGLCLHRVDTSTLAHGETRMSVEYAEGHENGISRLRLALNTWRLYRGAGWGLLESLRVAIKAYRSET